MNNSLRLLLVLIVTVIVSPYVFAGNIEYANEDEYPFGYNWEINTQSSARSPASIQSMDSSIQNKRDEGWLEVQKLIEPTGNDAQNSEKIDQ